MSSVNQGCAKAGEPLGQAVRSTQDSRAAQCPCRVVIVGAGLGGLAAAIGLRRCGHHVTVLEKTRELREVGAGIQIPANSSRVLAELGVLEEVQKYSVEPHSLTIRSYQGPVLFTQNLCPAIPRRFQFPHLLIHRADLRRILFGEAQHAGAVVRLGVEVHGIDLRNNSVRSATGEHFQADVILGADGEHSICREILLDRPDPPHSSGDIVFRIAVPIAEIDKDPGLACLVDPPQVLAWYGPESHAVCYRLSKDGVFNIVLTIPDKRSGKAPLLGPQPGDLDVIRQHCATWDPKFRKLLLLAEKALKWNLLQTHELKSWVHPRGYFALLGDSAHATLPYLAQGAAMALESGYVISCLLSKVTSLSQLPFILRLYASIRQPRTRRAKQRSHEMRDTCQLPDGPAQRERDRVFKEEKPGPGFPNPWADPEFQQWMWGFDARAETESIWQKSCEGSRETDRSAEEAAEKGNLKVVLQEEKTGSKL